MFRRLVGLYFRETCHVRTWAFLAVMLLLTAVFAFGGMSAGGDGIQVYDPIRLSVVDDDNSLISRSIVDQLDGIATLDRVYVETMAEARARLENDEILLLLHIPTGFYARAREPGASAGVEVWLNDRMPTEAAVFVRFLESAADSVSASKAALFAFEDEVAGIYTDEQKRLDESDAAAISIIMKLVARKTIVRIQEAAKLDTGLFILSALTCLYTLQTTLLLLPLVRRERQSGVYDRMLLHSLPWWKPAAARTLVGLVWLAAGVAPLFAVLYRSLQVSSVFLPIGAVVLMYAAGSLLVQAWAPVAGRDDTALLAAWAAMLGLLLLGGCIYPLRLLPVWIQQASKLSSARWAFSSLYDTFSGLPPTWDGPAALAAMLLPASVLTWLSWRKTRWGS